jgi:hypothetical protein
MPLLFCYMQVFWVWCIFCWCVGFSFVVCEAVAGHSFVAHCPLPETDPVPDKTFRSMAALPSSGN